MRGLRIASFAVLVAALAFGAATTMAADNGLLTKSSAHPASMTLDRLEASLKERGFTIFTRIDHAAAAKAAGLTMPPATVLVFGTPRGGTPVFLKKPSLAIDLPLKALVWDDAGGKTSVTYNSAAYVFGTIYPRHGVPANAEAQQKLEKTLAEAVDAAVQ